MSETIATLLWLEWTCLSCELDQTTSFRGESQMYVAICSRCRIVHVADRHSMTDSLPESNQVVLPIAPNGEPLHIGPVAFQKAHLLSVAEQPKLPADEGATP